MYKRLATLLSATLFSFSVSAGVIFQDNFDSELPNGGSQTNYDDFLKWDVTLGTVDLIATPNDWNLTCAGGVGKCVDLDGSNKNAGTLQSIALTLDPGTYTLSFDISGNQRNSAADSVEVSLDGFLTETFLVSANDPWQTIVRDITLTSQTTSNLIFEHNGGDNIGILLDNVSLVPEPGTVALLGLGLFGLIGARKKFGG
ncbi:PEP-CTERM sorting domain-containing protein [Marinobacter manganoxydans]|nr:PEP-CTERM sorting domain-containing protein [Marinobacter manganoxydans]